MEQWLFLLRSKIEELDINTQQFIYDSFYKQLYADIYFLIRDHGITEDIIQDAFLKVTSSAPKLKHDTHLKSWVRRVTRNCAIDWIRKNKKNRQEYEYLDVNISNSMFNEEISVASEIENNTRDELLHQALNELKPSYRIILLMFYWEQKSYKEICNELAITEQVLTQRLARARKKLFQHFSRKWVDDNE
ncbi:RNA polymerase sigma factor [Paenibacillus sp. IHBB 10380]|uniref:RNA polymerase sigma factor n=1 Tax=Paenibacillus sp. IHBB 10380 TaxID=1566358 RepID=UPI0005CFB533|nr:sigma-70 family RNA polymerase sigma factor [Paenibacillus sp. IHBB 10380]AJS61166.1 hypothetical protein UB51_25080 [Paenibacillus sp. IHBB 10380]